MSTSLSSARKSFCAIAKGTAIVLAGSPLLALLRLPQRYAPRESVSLGAILAAIWIVVAWQIFA